MKKIAYKIVIILLVYLALLPFFIKNKIASRLFLKRVRKITPLSESAMCEFDKLCHEESDKFLHSQELKTLKDAFKFIKKCNRETISYWQNLYDCILNKAIY